MNLEQILIIIVILWALGLVGGIGGELIHMLIVVAAVIFLLRYLGVANL